MKWIATIFTSVITSLLCFALMSIRTTPNIVWMNDGWRAAHPESSKPKRGVSNTNESVFLLYQLDPGPSYFQMAGIKDRIEIGAGSDGLIYWRTAPEDQTNLFRHLKSKLDSIVTNK